MSNKTNQSRSNYFILEMQKEAVYKQEKCDIDSSELF
jgi:hypothetical protein